MTALLDRPLPDLHPPARLAPRPLIGPAAPASNRAIVNAPTPTPVAPPPRVPGPRPARPVSARPPPGGASAAACADSHSVTPAHPPHEAAAALPSLRLTRRARLSVTLLSALSMLAVIGLAALNAEPMQGRLQDAPSSVVVQVGDTLWQIAAEVAPSEDPAAVVELLRSANGLDRSALQPGQVLVIPRG